MNILYFGIYDPTFSRNRIYISGLKKAGTTIIECRDASPGLLKYWKLWRKHRTLSGSYDVMVVGYPGHIMVPFAKLLSSAPVVADLLGSLTDAEVNSRAAGILRKLKSGIADHLAVHYADVILLESNAQKRFFIERFGPSEKYHVLYTGADELVFHCPADMQRNSFIVLFRGRLTPESGISYVLEAARILKKNSEIKFRIIGFGQLLDVVKETIVREELTNVELISQYLQDDELRWRMCEASLSLGQFENNPRLSRTIPHKAFESLAMGIPYVSGDAPAIREVIDDERTGFLVPLCDADLLASKIQTLFQDPASLAQVSTAARSLFNTRFAHATLAGQLSIILSNAIKK